MVASLPALTGPTKKLSIGSPVCLKCTAWLSQVGERVGTSCKFAEAKALIDKSLGAIGLGEITVLIMYVCRVDRSSQLS